MLSDALLAYAHFSAIFLVAIMLALECALLYRDPSDGLTLRSLLRADLRYFGAAVAAVLTGSLRLAFGVKGFSFYSTNPVLYMKVGLFVIIGLISIAPTLQYVSWVKGTAKEASFVPSAIELRRVRKWVWLELVLLALMPLLATFLARGIHP